MAGAEIDPARALLLADHAIVERQNLSWIARRFGVESDLLQVVAPPGGPPDPDMPIPFDLLPARQRWVGLLRRAVTRGDADAWRRIYAALAWRLRGRPPEALAQLERPGDVDALAYAAWRRAFDTLGPADRVAIAAGVASGTLPDILVRMRFTPDQQSLVGPALAALQAQLHPGWSAALEGAETAAGGDPRLCPAAARLVVLADPGVVLRPETLFAFAEAFRANPAAQLIYADEDRVDPEGHRHAPLFKPDFSPELCRRAPYLGPCVAVAPDRAATAVADVAAWAAELALSLPPEQVVHVPRILFHVPDAAPAPPRHHPAPPLTRRATVAIVIPTRNLAKLLAACVDSIHGLSDYPPENLRIVVLDNGSDDPATLALLDQYRAEPRMLVVRDDGPFNYARINNVAARACESDVLVFLNNDTEIVQPDWLQQLAGWAMRPEIGVVGARLLYPDRTIQHAGVVLGIGGVAGHSFVGQPGDASGYLHMATASREVTAVTGACLAVRRAVFEQVGGFDERLEIAFNDTALCCEAIRHGYRNLYAGEVAVVHHESKSRGFDDTPDKLRRFRQECLLVRAPYKDLFDHDPRYSANLGLERQYQPSPPRLPRPWQHERRRVDPHPRVLILSDVHGIGHGVAVVIQQHAEGLAARGCTVFVGGRLQANEIRYEGCLRVYLDGPHEAEAFAAEAAVDVVIAHTMPFFSMFRLMGGFPRRVMFDHGEPPPAFFPHDRQDRENIDAEKQFCYRTCELVLTNTATVKDEIGYAPAEVAGLGNSHLATWSPAMALRRTAIRTALGLDGRFVVLNVCRFHKAERVYKGIDDYVALRRRLLAENPALAARVAFVLCGKGSATDRADMETEGLHVFSNVTDAALAELYIAADLYVNFSKWEGYNLGIAQGLAMGLDVVASDIPAHRQFPIVTSDDPAERLASLVEAAEAPSRERTAVLFPWDPLLDWLYARLDTLARP